MAAVYIRLVLPKEINIQSTNSLKIRVVWFWYVTYQYGWHIEWKKYILYFTHWLIIRIVYRVGSLSRTIKRYDGVATQGSSILILFVQYILPTNLNKCIYYWARTYSILIYLVGGSAHEYTDMLVLYSFQIYLYTVAKPKHNQNKTTPNAQRTNISYLLPCVSIA